MRKLPFYIILLLIICIPQIIRPVSAESDIDRVIIISVDSMNNSFIFNEYDNPEYRITPNIGRLVKNGAAFTEAEAVMPTKTQVNHVTIVSGSYAERIGIVGNYVFDPTKRGKLFFQKYDYPWKNPELIKADTVFKAMERENPEYTSAVIAGKNYVGCPIWADIQVAPASTSKSAEELGIKKFPEIQLWDSPDEWVMDNVLTVLDEVDPNVILVNLGFLDPVQHSMGHGSMESWAALSWADFQIGRLLKYLSNSDKLDNTLLIVTADHGQTNTWDRIPVSKALRSIGVKANVVADGAFVSIFLNDKGDLERSVEFLEGLDCIDGVWYERTFDEVHIDTPVTGDIALSIAPPYEAFSKVRPPFMGIHGGLQQRFVPIIFFGPNIKRGVTFRNASLTDIVPTICELTGFPLPNDSQGEVLPVIDRAHNTSPEISYELIEYPDYRISYITLIFLILSLVILIPALLLLRHHTFGLIDVSPNTLSDIVPSLLLTSSTIFAIGSSFYSYIVNLYSVPGIQPDSFLVAMDFGILGSFLVSISLTLFILWYLPIIARLIIQKIRKRSYIITSTPNSMMFLIVSQLIFTTINTIVEIPYNIAFELFILFFFGGLGLSYLSRIITLSKREETNRKDIILMIISGILVGLFWFYLMMFLLFPNYLYEYGIKTIY